MADVSGSIRQVTLDGVTFDAVADANVKATPSQFENSAIATSGRNLHKMIKRVQSREGVVLIVNGAEQEALKALAERTADFPMSYTTAGGDVYRAVGWIEFESHETEENRASVQMHPRNGWDAFLAA